MKPFDLQAAKAGAPIVTRDGREVRFIAHVPEICESQRVLILINGNSHLTSYPETGVSPTFIKDCDLFMKPQKRTVWVNMYKAKADEIHSVVYWNEFNALSGKSEKSLAVAVPIEIEIP